MDDLKLNATQIIKKKTINLNQWQSENIKIKISVQ